MAGPPVVHDAAPADARAISAIYNALIPTATIAWTEATETFADRAAWMAGQAVAGRPVLVATIEDEVVGFASYADFRDSTKWPGYRFTVEHTVHVAESSWGAGIGRLLMGELVDRARAAGLHVMIGAIDGSNDASIRFHERVGFRVVGRLPETGFKFDRWLDLVFMQRDL